MSAGESELQLGQQQRNPAEVAALDVAAALQRLGTSRAGLPNAEAEARIRLCGPNRIPSAARAPAWLRLLRQFTQLFSIILWLAAALALAAEYADPGQGMMRLALALVIVIVVSGVFAHLQEGRAERTLAALRKLLPASVTVRRDGRTASVVAEALVPGDLLLLGQGDIVPADCRVIDALALRVSLATLTGEAAAQLRQARADTSPDPLRSTNLLLAGSAIVSGQAQAVAYATGAATELGRIAGLAQTAPPTPSPLQRELARLSRVIGLLALAIGALAFVVGAALGIPVWQDLVFSIGVIVAMVPEGLLPTLTVSLALATQRMARRQVLVRRLASIETLGCVSVICSDKTGTLTTNRLQASELAVAGRSWRFDGAAVPAALPLRAEGIDLFTVARWCQELKGGPAPEGPGQKLLGDPTETALVEMACRARPELAEAPLGELVDALPFDSDRMRQSVVYAAPTGRVLLCKGAPESVLRCCTSHWNGDAAQPLDEAVRSELLQGAEQMAERGLRVLAFAWGPLPIATPTAQGEHELEFLGLVGLHDPPRPEVATALERCRSAGIRVVMITGDHPRTALALAAAVGLVSPATAVVATGDELEAMDDAQLAQLCARPDVLFARTTARHKLRIVQALKAQGHVVAVTGDGVNDAPALKAAHVGVAMGLTGADVARQAADLVLLDDNFASIVSGIEEGRAVYDNIRKFLTYVLTHNVAELVPYLAFALARIPLPLTPIQALAIDMGTDSLTAVGLGTDAAEAGLMRRPPRKASERLLSLGVALRAYLFLGPIEAAAAMAAYFAVLSAEGWHRGQSLAATDPAYLRATTACMVAIVVMQLVNVFLCRSSTRSVAHTGVGGNRWITGGLAFALLLTGLIVYTPWGGELFGTAPVPAWVWGCLFPFALAMLLLEELRKAWVRRQTRRA